MVVAVREEKIEEKGSNVLMTRVCFKPIRQHADSTILQWTITNSSRFLPVHFYFI